MAFYNDLAALMGKVGSMTSSGADVMSFQPIRGPEVSFQDVEDRLALGDQSLISDYFRMSVDEWGVSNKVVGPE